MPSSLPQTLTRVSKVALHFFHNWTKKSSRILLGTESCLVVAVRMKAFTALTHSCKPDRNWKLSAKMEHDHGIPWEFNKKGPEASLRLFSHLHFSSVFMLVKDFVLKCFQIWFFHYAASLPRSWNLTGRSRLCYQTLLTFFYASPPLPSICFVQQTNLPWRESSKGCRMPFS